MSEGTLTLAPIEHCRYNRNKGLWETHPFHWLNFNAAWVTVGLPFATELRRGVHDDGSYNPAQVERVEMPSLYPFENALDDEDVITISATAWAAIVDKMTELEKKIEELLR